MKSHHSDWLSGLSKQSLKTEDNVTNWPKSQTVRCSTVFRRQMLAEWSILKRWGPASLRNREICSEEVKLMKSICLLEPSVSFPTFSDHQWMLQSIPYSVPDSCDKSHVCLENVDAHPKSFLEIFSQGKNQFKSLT